VTTQEERTVALNDDEKRLLAELQQRMNEPDEDDDYEVEVYDTTAGKGARVPYKAAKGWLHDVFGIGTPAAAPGDGGGDGGTGDEGAPPAGPAKGKGKSAGYFGRS
jgi:hypothetical protein